MIYTILDLQKFVESEKKLILENSNDGQYYYSTKNSDSMDLMIDTQRNIAELAIHYNKSGSYGFEIDASSGNLRMMQDTLKAYLTNKLFIVSFDYERTALFKMIKRKDTKLRLAIEDKHGELLDAESGEKILSSKLQNLNIRIIKP